MAGFGDSIFLGHNAPVVGKDELGNPIYLDIFGRKMAVDLPAAPPPEPEDKTRAGVRDAISAYTTRQSGDWTPGPRGGPESGRASPLVDTLASEAWRGVAAPGRALSGEDVTLGDTWATALDWGMMSPAGTAPEGALRAGAARGHNQPPAWTSADVRRPGQIMYSEGSVVARNLPQEKGTVGQFRAQLLKNGVKPDELTWSGFDRAFPDPNAPITRTRIANFFDDSGNPLSASTRKASGELGAPGGAFDETREFEYFFDNELMDDEANAAYRADASARLAEQGHADPSPLAIEHEVERLVEQAWDNWGRDSAREAWADAGFFDPGTTQYSRYFTPGAENYTETLYYPATRDEAFGGPPPDFYGGAHFGGSGTDMAVHTRAGDFETPLGERVKGVFETQSDMAQRNRGKIRTPEQETELANLVAQATEAGQNVASLDEQMRELVRARPMESSGAFVDAQSVQSLLRDGNLPRYEQQLWLDARARVPEGQVASPLQYSQTVRPDENGLLGVIAANDPGYGHAFDPAYMPDPWDPRVESVPSARREYTWWAENNNVPTTQPSLYDWWLEKATEGSPDGGLSQFATQQRNMPVDPRFSNTSEATRSLTAMPSTSRTRLNSAADLGLIGSENAPPNNALLHDYVPDKVQRNMAYYGTDPEQPALPLGFTPEQEELADLFYSRRIASDDAMFAQDAVDQAKRGTVPAAPFVTNTDKWVDAALRRELATAVDDGAYDYFAVGNPEIAADMTMMPEKAGTKFYGEIVPKRLQKLVDKVAPGHLVEMIQVKTRNGLQSVPAVKLTKEFLEAVERNGIPYYAIPGGYAVLQGTGEGEPALEEVLAPSGGT